MEFAYYEAKSLNDFENELKTLALNKKYTFSKETEVLKEEEILEKSNSHERELLKVFKDNAQITTYHFKSSQLSASKSSIQRLMGIMVLLQSKKI